MGMARERKAFFEVPAKIILPAYWKDKVRYRIGEDIYIAGYRVPEGYETDGASVPRFLWWLFPPVGRYLVAAIVHDHALERGNGWRVSNALFGEVLKELEIVGWRRKLMLWGVGLNGKWQHVKDVMGFDARFVRNEDQDHGE